MLKRRLLKDKIARHYMLFATVLSIFFLFLIGGGLLYKSLPIMEEKSLWTLLTTSNWRPFKGDFGFASYILSTLFVTGIAIVIALPLSLLTSIYIIEYASPRILRAFSSVVDLLRNPAGHLRCVGYSYNRSIYLRKAGTPFCRILNRLQCPGRGDCFGNHDYSINY